MDPRAPESLTAEFSTEPYETEGDPPQHALAAHESATRAGVYADFGPLGTTVHGERDRVLDAVQSVLRAALDHGADRITLQVRAEPDHPTGSDDSAGSPASPGPPTEDPDARSER